ncbi:hypothetical protein V8G54_024830 [Vigna mungo]|uniref:Uncharacterized protein n=1 Tax=Vigna mungo TaxID=3915 RepID=A0AAQ3RTH4_VIGMU
MSSQINSFKISFNCIVPYLYSLQIPLIPVYVRFVHVPLPLEACQEPFIVRASCTGDHSPPSQCPGVTFIPRAPFIKKKKKKLNNFEYIKTSILMIQLSFLH